MKKLYKDKIYDINANMIINKIEGVKYKENDVSLSNKEIGKLKLSYENNELKSQNGDKNIKVVDEYNITDENGVVTGQYKIVEFKADAAGFYPEGDYYAIEDRVENDGTAIRINLARVYNEKILTENGLHLLTGAFFVKGVYNGELIIKLCVKVKIDNFYLDNCDITIYGEKLQTIENIKCKGDCRLNCHNLEDNRLWNVNTGLINDSFNEGKTNLIVLDLLNPAQHATAYAMYPVDCDVMVKIEQSGYTPKYLTILKGATSSDTVKLDSFWLATNIIDISHEGASSYKYVKDSHYKVEIKETLADRISRKILNKYRNSRQSVNVTAAITDKSDIYDIGDEVKIIMARTPSDGVTAEGLALYEQRYSFSRYRSGEPKIYRVTGVELKYNGVWRQKLELIEIPDNVIYAY